MRISSNASQLLTSFSEAYLVFDDILLNGSLTSPKAAGESERLDMILLQTNFSTLQDQYYIAIVVINANNKVSQVSNVAPFRFNTPAQPTASSTVLTTLPTIQPISDGSSFPGWAIAVIVIGCVIFLAIIGLAVYCICKPKPKVMKYTESEPKITITYNGPETQTNFYETIKSQTTTTVYENI